MIYKPVNVDTSRFKVEVGLVDDFRLVGIIFFAYEQYASYYL
jgi:hypothetical protein